MQPENSFAALGLGEPLLASLVELGYEEPTPIQRAAVPPLLAGKDLLGQAATGTGKTAAFTLPMLARVERDGRTRALVLVPTRELAIQVAEAVERYGRGLGTKVLAVYGGAPMPAQVKALARGITVVVATPGRALDHLQRGTLKLDRLTHLVLDEADEMLDMGFAEDLDAILAATPASRQTALFSATLPPRIAAIAARHLRDPVRITIAREVMDPGALPRVRQLGYLVQRPWKLAALARVLDCEEPAAAIVFCRTRTEVDEIGEALRARGRRVEALHGGLSQAERDRVMRRFRAGAASLLVATDVAARGLDIEQLSHVINFEVPSAPEAYVHRIGRTGRAGREGTAVVIAEPRERRLLANIESLTGQRIQFAPLPTGAELRRRRQERLLGAVGEALRAPSSEVAAELEGARAAVRELAATHPLEAVAAAALALLGRARQPVTTDEDEIPAVAPAPSREGARAAGHSSGARPPSRGAAARPSGPGGPGAATSLTASGEMARLWVGAGSLQGIRPGDLVGAISNEAALPSTVIGAIRISLRFSTVEVAVEVIDRVLAALGEAKVKGKKVVVRRDRDRPGGPRR